jgi:MtN3 and saliva related transmembrane protein
MSGATAIGALSAILTTFSWIPQALKTIRTRRADDFSWSYLAMFASGVSGWVAYGVLRNDPIIIGANAVAAGLILPIIVIKSRYRNQKPSKKLRF